MKTDPTEPSAHEAARTRTPRDLLVGARVPVPVLELTPRVHAAVLAGVGDLAPTSMRIPNEHYTDPVIAALERQRSFGAPLLIAPSAIVPSSGDYVTMDLLGSPIIVTRGTDGGARVLLNACRHRGAKVVAGDGCSRRLTCPYHNWVYDTEGRLVGIPDRESVGDLEIGTLSLVELPSEERHGFVWAMRDPGGVLDLDSHLGPLDAELAAWECGYEVAARMDVPLASNWKCAMEAFQETYHFPYVHARSMPGHGTVANIVTFDQFGRHHRLGVPLVSMGREPDPRPGENLTCIYYIYPCTVLSSSPLGGELLQFYPGPTPASSTIRHTVLSRFPMADDAIAAVFEMYVPKIQEVVLDEDAVVIQSSGEALAAGLTDVVLGRNEIGCQAAHREIMADLT